jgi:hypothetical protein
LVVCKKLTDSRKLGFFRPGCNNFVSSFLRLPLPNDLEPEMQESSRSESVMIHPETDLEEAINRYPAGFGG